MKTKTKLSPITITPEVCSSFEASSRLEWLETNGLGGYAMGTVSTANTRRYHGLLVASLAPPTQRYVMLAKVEESVTLLGPSANDNRSFDLSANQYPGVVHPRGFERLASFRLDPFPTWTFDLENGRTLEKRLFLVRGEQTVILQYRTTHACRLRVQPMLAFRDYHAMTHQNRELDPRVWEEEVREENDLAGRTRVVHIRPYGALPALRVAHNGERLIEDGCWHHNAEYLRELDRGLDYREDLYRIGTIEIDLAANETAFVVTTVEPEQRTWDLATITALEEAERARRTAPYEDDALTSRLALAADQFLVHRQDQSLTVIAGYPWFTDWGRDTMIALPGLLIARGRLREAESVIEAFLRYLDGGLIPNRFPDYEGDAIEYNTVDATLWLFQAVHAYLEAGGSEEFVRRIFYPAAREILAWHRKGTHHGIVVDESDGLLIAGGEGTQLTWMDARVDGRVMTPRHGKPVEINALYYNALSLMTAWARRFGDVEDDAFTYERQALRVGASFEEKFWNAERGCLFDVLLLTAGGEWVGDPKIRPNQVIALSLPYPLLSIDKRKRVMNVAERLLLTHVGLRTLSSEDEGYEPRYSGSPAQRDAAYHQGVIWPWLLGPYVRAYLSTFGRSPDRIAYCRALFRGLELHLNDEGCLGTICEIFEAEPPFRAEGAPAQAWSVAELLSVLLNELGEGHQPPKASSPSWTWTRPRSALVSSSI